MRGRRGEEAEVEAPPEREFMDSRGLQGEHIFLEEVLGQTALTWYTSRPPSHQFLTIPNPLIRSVLSTFNASVASSSNVLPSATLSEGPASLGALLAASSSRDIVRLPAAPTAAMPSAWASSGLFPAARAFISAFKAISDLWKPLFLRYSRTAVAVRADEDAAADAASLLCAPLPTPMEVAADPSLSLSSFLWVLVCEASLDGVSLSLPASAAADDAFASLSFAVMARRVPPAGLASEAERGRWLVSVVGFGEEP